jgi:hypothetical protein
MFRFTIRDVLWLMVVVGRGVGGGLEYGRLNHALATTNAEHRDHRRKPSKLRVGDEARDVLRGPQMLVWVKDDEFLAGAPSEFLQ